MCYESISGCHVRHLAPDFLSTSFCKSIEREEREECYGNCNSFSSNQILMNDGFVVSSFSSLSCCQPSEIFNQTIKMSCLETKSNSYIIQDVTYVRIKSCSCKQCYF